MPKPRKAVLLALAFVVSMPALGATEFKDGEVIVKYRRGISRARVKMNALYHLIGVKNIRRFSTALEGTEHLILAPGVSVSEAISKLEKDERVEYAQPNYTLHTLPVVDDVGIREVINTVLPFPMLSTGEVDNGDLASARPAVKPAPEEVVPAIDDPDLAKAYGLSKIGAIASWSSHRCSKDLIVGNIDTGGDYNHADLAGNRWINPNPGSQNDVVGYDFVHNDGLPYDDNIHGTHTAGTIGAVGGNGIGISGVAQRVSIMSLKFLDGDGYGTTSDAVRAIDYAVEHGAKILNNSWGGKGLPSNRILLDAITRAQAQGVLFVAAAGNNGVDNDSSDASYPAAYGVDNIIAVAATDQNDKLAYFSNYSKTTTQVAAPGVGIYSTIPGNKYKKLSGTSMAAPHVTGALAMIWSMHREWDYKQVKQALFDSVDVIPGLEGKTVTGGRINLAKALSVKQ